MKKKGKEKKNNQKMLKTKKLLRVLTTSPLNPTEFRRPHPFSNLQTLENTINVPFSKNAMSFNLKNPVYFSKCVCKLTSRGSIAVFSFP